jgi:hypothetical protein
VGAGAQNQPISGPDEFEPDNTPDDATWRGLVEQGDGSTARRHNFHRKDDVDWFAFYAAKDMYVIVRTFETFPLADTLVNVYRLRRGDENPGQPPAGCSDLFVDGPDGDELIAVACNDDAGGTIPQIRSRVNFVVPFSGLYYVEVKLSPKAEALGKQDTNLDEDTTYSVQAVNDPNQGAGLLFNAYFATLIDESEQPIEDGEVFVTPIGFDIDDNTDGIYAIPGLPDGTYTVTASAPNFDSAQRVIQLSGGETVNDAYKLNAIAVPHSADYDGDPGVISLPEVLRVIQFYNAGALHCDGGTEDGFAPGDGSTGCNEHSSDYSPHNWEISLAELLRLIQLFNAGGIVACDESEDGYCVK